MFDMMWVMKGNAVGDESIEVDRCIASVDLNCDGTSDVHSCEVWCGMLIARG